MAASLKNYLIKKFGQHLNITTFQSSENCLQNLNKETHVVILDQDLLSAKEADVRLSIKAINPKAEVILFVNNDEAAVAAELFRKGSRGYITRNNYLLNKISWLIRKTITEPIEYIIREFGVPTFMLIFFSTFIVMGVIVYLVLKQIQ